MLNLIYLPARGSILLDLIFLQARGSVLLHHIYLEARMSILSTYEPQGPSYWTLSTYKPKGPSCWTLSTEKPKSPSSKTLSTYKPKGPSYWTLFFGEPKGPSYWILSTYKPGPCSKTLQVCFTYKPQDPSYWTFSTYKIEDSGFIQLDLIIQILVASCDLEHFSPPPPPAWMSVHSGLPHNIFQVLLTVCWYSFILLGGEKHFHKQLSCQSTTQWPNQGSNPQFPSESKHSTPGHHTSPSARNCFI